MKLPLLCYIKIYFTNLKKWFKKKINKYSDEKELYEIIEQPRKIYTTPNGLYDTGILVKIIKKEDKKKD
mgnify:CR=1 FL=1